MGLYYNGHKVKNLYYNGKCITRLALGKELTRLVEGDDFVRAQWLVGDGTAYIDTNIIYLDGVVDLIAMVEGEIGKIGREKLNNSSDFYSRFVISINPSNGLAIVFSSNQADAYITQPLVLQIDVQNDSLTINGTVKSLDFIPNTKANSIYLFAVNRFNKPYISSQSIIKISKFSISSKINLTPCRLLRPIPAALDANGIARNADECGMYDSVSGKFFGNVAASGAFTVYRLVEGVDYEVHDILKTLAENTSSAPYDVAYFRFPNYISLIGKVLTLKLGNVYRDYSLEGDIVNNARYYILIYRAGLITTIQERLGNTVLNSVSNSSSTVEIDFDNNVVSVGTSTMNIQGTGYYTFGENNVSWGTEKYLKGLIISDVLNLIPVKLLKSIPSKYDANGIARQAGECGMYDTVNDKFYGNVASSGSFTVSDD